MENIISSNRINADILDDSSLFDVVDTRKIDIIAINEGNLPLHGEKTFVKIAIIFSFFDSIILVPMTPHALHPYPMHIVKHCFP